LERHAYLVLGIEQDRTAAADLHKRSSEYFNRVTVDKRFGGYIENTAYALPSSLFIA
jgi:hypothetical protein